VTGSPITTSGNITINIPTASATNRGLLSAADWTTFNNKQDAGNFVTLDTTQNITGVKTFVGSTLVLEANGTALKTRLQNISGTQISTSGVNSFGFNSENNIYFAGSAKGGGVIAFNNTVSRTYTLQNASGTLALTSDLTDFVTLSTAQTITATKTFNNSGSASNIIVNHTSGSGIALDITKGGNGEGIRVNKTSGSGNAATIIGTLEATTLVKTGGTDSQYLMADGSVSTLTNPVTGTGVAGQVSFWNGVNTQAGDSGLVWDNGNKSLEITSSGVPQYNLTATGRTGTSMAGNISFFNDSGLGWRIGNTGTAGGVLRITNRLNAPIVFDVNDLESWRILSTGILQSNGAQTIQTSTGNLTLATAGGNGDILLSPNGTGNVGIGTSDPSDKLEIGGAGAGIILASPDGTRYRVTVTDLGVLTVAAV
jgi:hypothetical protein